MRKGGLERHDKVDYAVPMQRDNSKETPVRSLADALLRGMGGSDRALLVRLWQHWDMVLGPELAALALPLGHRDGLLLLGAEDSMTLQEVSLLAPEILERVNAFMDSPFFRAASCSLLQHKRPLNTLGTLLQRPAMLVHEPPPPLHGQHLAQMRPDSPVARCYARFLRAREEH